MTKHGQHRAISPSFFLLVVFYHKERKSLGPSTMDRYLPLTEVEPGVTESKAVFCLLKFTGCQTERHGGPSPNQAQSTAVSVSC